MNFIRLRLFPRGYEKPVRCVASGVAPLDSSKSKPAGARLTPTSVNRMHPHSSFACNLAIPSCQFNCPMESGNFSKIRTTKVRWT